MMTYLLARTRAICMLEATMWVTGCGGVCEIW